MKSESNSENWECRALLATLRQLLKARKLTYQDVAQKLGVSEQTIKRLFTADDVPINRIVDLCGVVNVTFFELAKLADEGRERTFAMTAEQEEYFTENPEIYAVFDALLRGHTFESLQAKYRIPSRDLREVLKQLEKQKLGERGAGDSFRLAVSGTHNWRRGGPLQKKFIEERNTNFVRVVSKKVTEDSDTNFFMTTSDRQVSESTLTNLLRDMGDLFAAFRKQAQRDESFVASEKLIAVKWLGCLAPVEPQFEKYLNAFGRKLK